MQIGCGTWRKSTVLSKRAASVKISIAFYQVPTYRHGHFGLLTEFGGRISGQCRAMALETVEALAVRSRRSESRCHPPRVVVIKGGMGGLAMRAITAHRDWPLHADDWHSGGWCGREGAVQ